ncbi:MAG: 23S rRNA (adenine(2503)-C(2))-methyltransferase RlmN [Bacillota bacterium]|nr:23S rRNA (adenine(2503)-C(2))-methyltransferase RlmN [Bacillota bacterium]MDI9415412.1 23S rRNA (adenine(2503)-C(2))-methyltransferase RlmN [Bacillota bacterium]HOB88149.1 23S rRNA (adenine(2503)-C(2))-methyltransferase RlmN [Bacillota bacterium]HOJ57896.1 23S rRNA (adenine(2503)-C(2))-methyltransferase RlmN [Bacillota bacterium]HOL01464.1 23S rRNA (adenine(2503)-C(2))-methyltransferase RlmN [Bacillota bacterium]
MEDIKSLLPDELKSFMVSLGQPSYRGSQVFSWLHKHLVYSFDDMTNLPLGLRKRLGETAFITSLNILSRTEGRKGTVKYLMETYDKNAVEAVRMEYKYGITACLSTQVGCKMACSFCASGQSGFIRNLTTSEIVDQALKIQKDVSRFSSDIGNIVLMGTGEPLDNYEASVKALRLFNAKEGLGISFRRMAVSTCGLVPGIRRLAEEGIPVTLSISLHAATDDLRDKLMPINRRYPIPELLDAAAFYRERTGRRVTFEYTVIQDVNDSPACARQLAKLLQGQMAHVNLIPFNPIDEREFVRPTIHRMNTFQKILEEASIPTTVRRDLGLDVHAACGQLRPRYCR